MRKSQLAISFILTTLRKTNYTANLEISFLEPPRVLIRMKENVL